MARWSGGLAAGLVLVACGRPAQWTEPGTGIRLVRVPAGSFTMGSPPEEPGRESQEVPHRVTISRAFYMGATEVTQGQWQRVMGDNPSWFTACGPECPVERVSFLQVEAFLGRLNGRTHLRFRLPTEAEWEYACRAGTTTPFGSGGDLSPDQANFDGEGPYGTSAPGLYRRTTVPVGSFPPNRFGLYDLHGNVWEWTRDRHCPYPTEPAQDPVGTCDSPLQVIRGGSWCFDAASARCALRYTHRPQDSGFSLGFRLVLPAEELGRATGSS